MSLEWREPGHSAEPTHGNEQPAAALLARPGHGPWPGAKTEPETRHKAPEHRGAEPAGRDPLCELLGSWWTIRTEDGEARPLPTCSAPKLLDPDSRSGRAHAAH